MRQWRTEFKPALRDDEEEKLWKAVRPYTASARHDSACPESGPVPSNIKHCTIFYRACPKSGPVPRSPKRKPVPSIFEGMIGYDRACPKSGPVPNIS